MVWQRSEGARFLARAWKRDQLRISVLIRSRLSVGLFIVLCIGLGGVSLTYEVFDILGVDFGGLGRVHVCLRRNGRDPGLSD